MGSIGDSKNRIEAGGSSGGSSPEAGSAGGETGGDDSEQGFLDSILDGTAAEGGDGGETQAPGYTLPPPLSVKKRRGRIPGTKNKNTVTRNNGISPGACAAALQGLFSAGSLYLTGTLDLALSGGEKLGAEALNPQDEAGSLGKALADCLDTIPDSPITKAANLLGPWLAFGGLLATVIIIRIGTIAMMQAQQKQNPQPPIERPQPRREEPAAPTHYTVNCGICGQGLQTQADLERHVKEVHRV